MSPAAVRLLLEALAANALFVSLHDGEPAVEGSHELSGGDYVRVPVDWVMSSGEPMQRENAAPLRVPVPPGSTVSHFGLWTSSHGGDFLTGGGLVPVERFAGAGRYEIEPGELRLRLGMPS